MDYKNTLYLPNTDFPMKANLTQNEPERLKKWEKLNIYQQMRKNAKGKKIYHLHDGPPYANGHIHIGHAVNKILKDIIIKYYYKEGYDTPYIPGWDCHGLPIELQAEKNLSKNKGELSKLEIRKFCRSYAEKYIKVQAEEFQRLGVFGEWDNPYITMSYDYQANIVREFANIVKNGHVYRGKKPVYWCISCETALAEAEVEYDDHISPSIFVEFPIKSDISALSSTLKGLHTSIVIWTTTPWTLPANKAVAVHPDYEYVAVQFGEKVYIIAKELLQKFETILKKEGHIKAEFKGEKLAGLVCEHPLEDWDSIVLVADFVTLDTGTGCVHIAPGHGQEDYELGLKNNIEVYAPVDRRGNFTKNVKYFSGKNVAKVNEEIIAKLKELGKLVASGEISHSYPHCWRCKKPIIFRAEEQWFVSMDKEGLRKKALEEIDRVNWIPKWGRDRIYNMIQTRPDWCISRQRSWGVPIIAFFCNDCGDVVLDYEIINKVADIFEKHGADIWFEKDANFFLGENFKCKNCGSKNFEKEDDILDVWFDSGISYSYVKNRDGYDIPVDLYLEGSDQHRGWFHSSLLTACANYHKSPYKSVLTHGFVVDAEGRKMSKSLGNVISPQEVINKYGAEILRIWVASEDYREDIRISNEILNRLIDAYRRIRNTFRYMLGVLGDFDYEKNYVEYKNLSNLDKSILHRLYHLNSKVRKAYASFDFHTIFHLIHNFCITDLSAIYLDILKDRIYVNSQNDIKRRASQTVIFETFRILVNLLSPILAFTTDEAWEHINLKNKKESIHLEEFINPPQEWDNPLINDHFETLLDIRQEVQKALEEARRNKIIGHSLDAYVIVYLNEQLLETISQFFEELREIFIVSQIEIKTSGTGKFKGTVLPITIDIEKAKGEKCERCWVYSITVGQDETHKTICKRCVDVINEKV
ncbi:MAG: isoleucine--tRNA ligase [Proteobacteria bacterium]|nr:isoleucine--tRNA ligase [Pseudomonadota bacterium]